MTDTFDENPFSVTKAGEFSDSQIYEYWVNFNTEKGESIKAFLNPSEYLPKYIIGGKGCGKTHVLRYFSYQVRLIRHNDDIRKLLSEDGYIGLYYLLSGLNASRFREKGVSEDEWSTVFEYYFELYICDVLLTTIETILARLEVSEPSRVAFVESVTKFFTNYKDIENVSSLSDLIGLFQDLRRRIDFQILNVAYTRRLEYDSVKTLFSPGDLIFGIPAAAASHFEAFSKVKFIYVFDELEKLTEWQKVFINGLVWDKKPPATFWIGMRRYGFTTRATKSGQEMKAGSEFEPVVLDDIIRSNGALYKKFAQELCEDRLRKYFKARGLTTALAESAHSFFNGFQRFNVESLLEEIRHRNRKKEYPHLKELRKKLALGIEHNLALGLKDEDKIDSIVEAIEFETAGDPLKQKYKLNLFYKLWYQAEAPRGLMDIVDDVNAEFRAYLNGNSSSFDEILDKRKQDLIAQLAEENSLKNIEYSGFEEFVELSQGNVRCLLVILKKSVEFARIRGEKPLETGGSVSLESQYAAIFYTAKWFYEDAELYQDEGKHVYNSLKNLGDYMALHRFCDKPTETTVSCFYLVDEKLSDRARRCIELMELHAFIVEIEGGRKDKNTGIVERSYQLNKILSPLWNLPTSERGMLYLRAEIAEAIFDFQANSKFNAFYKQRKSRLNAPDFRRFSPAIDQAGLFDE